MHIEFYKPELEQFINAQVKAGRFETPQAAIEAAVEEMRQSFDGLDEETIDAIAKADQQYLKADYIEWRAIRSEMRMKYLGK